MIYDLKEADKLPAVERAAAEALLRVGVDLLQIKSIEAYRVVEEGVNIKVDTERGKILYKISRDFVLLAKELLLDVKKPRRENMYGSRNGSRQYQQKLRAAYAFFSV